MRDCITCKDSKPLSEFGVNRRYSDGLHRSCKECERKRRRAWYHTHRELELERYRRYCAEYPERRRATARKYRYGIEPDEYDRLMREQSSRCAVCGIHDENLHVDHDHKTKRVRGLLCGDCNRALGILKENPVRITALAEYAIQRCARGGDAT